MRLKICWEPSTASQEVPSSGPGFCLMEAIRPGQGRENAKIFLSENPDIAYELEDKIRAAHGLDFENPSHDDEGEILEA